MIVNRPVELEKIPYYNFLPNKPIAFDHSSLPEILRFDLFELSGLLPITLDISNLCPEGIITEHPSEAVIDYYKKHNINFQMIFVVANIYDIRDADEIITAKPYSICLVPASYRGQPDEMDIAKATLLELDRLTDQSFMYLEFDSFKKNCSLFGNAGTFLGPSGDGLNIYTDSVGFVIGVYLLASRFEKTEILLSNIISAKRYLQKKYSQYRIKRYFTQFKNLKPRKLWGTDSPIELFLIQALAQEGLFPDIQTLIFKDGTIFPNFYEMVNSLKLKNQGHLITEPDLYFKQQRLAIFCDSKEYHSSPEARAKDRKIDSKLEALGITSLRLPGNEIVNNLMGCVEQIKDQLEN